MLPDRESMPGGGAWLARDALRSMKHECVRLTIYLGLLALCAPLLLIPFLGPPVFTVVMTYITIRYLAWDGLDYCLSRRRLTMVWGMLHFVCPNYALKPIVGSSNCLLPSRTSLRISPIH